MKLPALLFLVTSFLHAVSADILVRLPTQNDHLLRGENEAFFMYVDRIIDGVNVRPWTGGTYGFVRTLVDTPGGQVGSRFHEGIDIKPLKRNADGTPLDAVRPVAPGTVEYVCSVTGRSNYGRYIVIRHDTGDGPLFSLYAHLAEVKCRAGDKVGTGNVIGILGYSGVGLDKRRAHLHLELGLMINEDFTYWFDQNIKSPNYHGNYNGLNLIGFDPVPLLVNGHKAIRTSLSRHIATLEPEYTARIPGRKMHATGKIYPFLVKKSSFPDNEIKSWDISFTGGGVPVSMQPSNQEVKEPTLLWVCEKPVPALYRTCRRVKCENGKNFSLTASGKSYLMMFSFERDVTDDSGKNHPRS